MYNGEIITCAVSNSPNMKLVMRMAKKAIKKFDSVEGLVMHSDQGWQYQHQSYYNNDRIKLRLNGMSARFIRPDGRG